MQSSLNKDKNDIDKSDTLYKHKSYQPTRIVNTVNSDNGDIIYLHILKKKMHFYRNQSLTNIYNYVVSNNNNTMLLSAVLQKCSHGLIDSKNVQQLIQQYPGLQNLEIGQIFSCLVLNHQKIKYLILKCSSNQIHVYENVNDYFTKGIIKIVNKSNDKTYYTILFIGELNETFIDSVRTFGLEENYILDIIKTLQYQLDFKKLRHGDRFSILVSFSVIDGSKKLSSKLIGARLCTSGKDYYIFKFDNGKFYNQDAVHLGNDFVRFPILMPYRISSGFNLHRLNPVTRQISPHAGIDFAVPIGTSVFSIGDGEVIASKYSKIAGNYINIKHNYQCVTRYMHLKKMFVKTGQKVKKGDQIALSGNTGRSTGPHLHFEIWINHRPVNPLTAKIFNSEKLLGSEKIKFLNQVAENIPKMSFD